MILPIGLNVEDQKCGITSELSLERMVRGSKSQKPFATTARVSPLVVQVVVQAI